MSSKIIKIESPDVLATVFGSCDSNVKIIEKKFGVAVHNRIADSGEDVVVVSGDQDTAVSQAASAVAYLVKMAKYNENINDQSVIYVCDPVRSGNSGELEELGDDTICADKGKDRRTEAVRQRDQKEHHRTRHRTRRNG